MDKRKIGVIAAVIIVLVGAVGLMVYQKSQVKPAATPSAVSTSPTVAKVDLSTQPAWVQNLEVTAKKGRSANGLDNVTVTVTGIPANTVSGVTYVMQYQTTNKGTQGALSMTPIDLTGRTTFSKAIDLGTCSTSSCVRHEGVTSVDLELDFVALDGSKPVWEKTLDL
ncbi:MAG: hypothetical protein M1484_01315 [Patescibacteria group bacterium]|nr:hypothetical protein [Patescibacteria group bacterium]MCL5431720.1 hypothetical protein [Patescibacteria group bacterium]